MFVNVKKIAEKGGKRADLAQMFQNTPKKAFAKMPLLVALVFTAPSASR